MVQLKPQSWLNIWALTWKDQRTYNAYNAYENGIIDEEKDLMFASEPELFSIGTINLPSIFIW
jgi:hypothetical protein